MDEVSTLFICIIVGLTIYFYKRKKKNFPPGPPGLPFFGNLLGLDLSKAETNRLLRKQYGDIFTLSLGPTKVVCINGYDNFVEAFVKNADVFSDRPKSFINAVRFDHSSKKHT